MTNDQFQKLFAELGEVRGEVGGLRGEVREIRGEIREVRGEVREVREVAERTAHGLDALQQRMDGMQHRMDGVEHRMDGMESLQRQHTDSVGGLQHRMDGFETTVAELHLHFDVVGEELRGQIQLVAEGLIGLGERMEAGRRETAAELSEIKSLIRVSYSDLDRRVSRLEEASGL